MPWAASDIVVRKRKPLSTAVEMAGDVAEGEIVGTPARMIPASINARVLALESGPMMPLTFSLSIRRRASATAWSAFSAVSPVTNTTFCPPTPPASLMCFSANCTPDRISSPNSASPPERSANKPSVSGGGIAVPTSLHGSR